MRDIYFILKQLVEIFHFTFMTNLPSLYLPPLKGHTSPITSSISLSSNSHKTNQFSLKTSWVAMFSQTQEKVFNKESYFHSQWSFFWFSKSFLSRHLNIYYKITTQLYPICYKKQQDPFKLTQTQLFIKPNKKCVCYLKELIACLYCLSKRHFEWHVFVHHGFC